MDPSRPRNRKQVTYGSASRRSISENIPENKAAPSPTPARRTLASRSPKAGISGNANANADKRPRTPGTTKAVAVATAGSQNPPDDNVYDIPSSDDENVNLILQRKRRRGGGGPKTSTNTLQISDLIASEDDKQNGDRILDSKPTETHSEMTPARARVTMQDRKRVQGQKRDTETQQPSPKKPKTPTPSTHNRNSRSRKYASSSEDELQKLVSPKYSPQEKEPKFEASAKSLSPLPSRPQTYTNTTAGNTTPGRRRLVDALGTRERSLDRTSSNGFTDSQLSSPVASQSPIRPRDTGAESLSNSQRELLAQEPTTAPSPHFLGGKVTYARQRSFLDDLNLSGDISAGVEGDSLFSPKGLTEALPRARLYEINDATNDDGAVRSIHELRQAGGNARYRSAIESIFEDIEDAQISVSGRCGALAQICGKLLDPKQARQFVECGFDKRIVDCLSRDLDLVSATLAFSVFGLSCAGRSLPYIIATAAWPKLLETVPLLLAVQKDVTAMACDRENNLSKVAQGIVQDIAPQIKSKLFVDDDDLEFSPCLLALFCLRVTISAFQEKGETPSGLSTELLRQLVDLLLSECSPESKQPIGRGRSQVLVLGLVLLETHTTSSSLLRDEHCDALKSLPALHSLLQVPDNSDEAGQELQNLYIRVILNVTNSSADLCDHYATSPMIEALAEIVMSKFNDLNGDTPSQSEGISSLDTVILTLGALINLTEQSEKSRVMFLNTSRGSESILDQLVHLFLEHVESIAQADSVPEVHHNVAVGYLAVLLLSLCLDRDVRLKVKEILHPKGLSVVMSTVDEFMQYHQKIELELHPMQNSNETGGFLGRLQELVGQIQFIE
ncbi:Wings apart-like protein, partial [Penicillium manginii]|uniref:Wings apart-like protein n=1 Tax=Penicillium manginii TaxID=203109 RepID=UPI00254882E9